MIGQATDAGTGDNNLYLLRYSPSLTTEYFHKVVPLPDNETGYDVVAMDDGFIVVGQLLSAGLNVPQGLFARFDLDGNLLAGQPRRFSGISGLGFRAIADAGGGNFYVSGFAAPGGNYDALVMKTDVNGSAAGGYPKILGHAGEEFISVSCHPDGGLILAGGLDNDALLIKLDPNSSEDWRVASGVNSEDAYSRVVPTPDGGYAVCGYRGESLYYAKTNDQGRVE